MVSACSASFLLASLGLCLGLSLDTVETATEERMVFYRKADDSRSSIQRQKAILLPVESKPAFSARHKRATENCSSGPITASTMEDPLFIILFDSIEQFDACLSNEVLKANLAPLLDQPLPDDFLVVIKRKLDGIYPDGIPDDQLKRLSYLSRLYSPEEIGKWRVTSDDTLATLLNPDSGAWGPDQLKQLVSTYMALGGNLTGPLLSMLGGTSLCLLEAKQLGQISPESVRQVEKLDISSCSQDKKDALYGTARTAFASQEGTSDYYLLIQPYLGGAPVEDLRKLARSQVAMDIGTFTNLKPEELKKLSVQDVRDLLTAHLPDLKDVENHPSVAMWVKSHLQSELDTLGIGLQGGIMSPSPTGSTDVGGSTAGGPSTAISQTTPAAVVSTPAVNIATSTTTFSSTNTFPLVATDSLTTPLFKVTLATDETPTSAEITKATMTSKPAEAAIPTDTTSKVTVTSEGNIGWSLVPTTAVDTTTTVSGPLEASPNITTNGTVSEVGGGVDAATSIDTVTVSTSVTTDGTILPSVSTHINVTTSVNTTAGYTEVTPGGTTQPTVASYINATTSVNTSAAATNVTTSQTILPTVATSVSVTSNPNATVSHTPTLSINQSSTTPHVTVTTSSEWPPAPPVPLPNATVPVPSGEMPATSSRTPLHSSETPRETAVSPTPDPPGTAVVPTPEKGTTDRAPPKTKQPPYPTPNGYIHLRPLSASASSLSLSRLLLMPSVAVGLSVLWRLF